MTHHIQGDDPTDPREALRKEFEHAPVIARKQRESWRITSLVRADRIANGLDVLIRTALEPKQ